MRSVGYTDIKRIPFFSQIRCFVFILRSYSGSPFSPKYSIKTPYAMKSARNPPSGYCTSLSWGIPCLKRKSSIVFSARDRHRCPSKAKHCVPREVLRVPCSSIPASIRAFSQEPVVSLSSVVGSRDTRKKFFNRPDVIRQASDHRRGALKPAPCTIIDFQP